MTIHLRDIERVGGVASTVMVGASDSHVAVTANDILAADEVDELIAVLQRARRRVFGRPKPSAVVMEIVERGRTTTDGTGSLILPNEVRINGTSVFTNGGVRVHETEIEPGKEMAQVTVTLSVRLLVIGAEGDLQP